MKYQARIIHHIPGRIRIQVPHAKGNHLLLDRISKSIAPRPGVHRVRVNPTNASIVIHYDPSLLDNFQHSLAEHVKNEELFTLDISSQREESGIARSLDLGLKELSDTVKHATDETIDLKEIFPFVVAIAALFFVDKTLGAPLWVSLLIFSFSSYMDLHEKEPETNEQVLDSIESLREEIAHLRAEIRRLSRQS